MPRILSEDLPVTERIPLLHRNALPLLALLLWCGAGLATAEPAIDTATPAPSVEAAANASPAPHPALALIGGSFNARAAAARQLASSGEPQAVAILEALLGGQLYGGGEPPQLVIKQGSAFSDALSGAALAELPTGARKIPVNNSLRGQLRDLLATLSLRHSDPQVRRDAALRLLGNAADGRYQPLLAELLTSEQHPEVRQALLLVQALGQLGSGSEQQQAVAVDTLADSLQPEIRNALEVLASADGASADGNPTLAAAARTAADAIDARIQRFQLLENIFFGLSLGSVLLLAAIGLAITFGVMGVINMAHGELIMIGAYTTYSIQLLLPNHISLALLLSIPAAFVVSGLVGIAIERGIIRHLYGRPLETLLATFGVSLILQQAVRSIYSPLNRAVSSPEWLSGSWQINPVFALTWNRLYILFFALAVFAALWLVLKHTRLGLQVRAVAQNRGMARAIGVRASRVDALTFGLGSGIAGVAGVALSQLTNVGPNLGQDYIIDSFLVVVFGGVGNLWGTLVGAFGLGIINKFLEPWAGAMLAKILVLIAIILFIQKRPRGLFPQKGRAAEG
ncbi:MAG: urea ABC transporter permease subunit UrtB [Gammaproteobacteria bacterium]|nr:urea ABC transporter permease subunit UrtB [Gammaproteobacteria bacterium]